jgi:hypothetical protein
LSLTNEEIVDLLNKLDKDSKAIKEDLLKTCWYMRGSISYNDAMMLSIDDRTMISKLIKDNLEVTKESGLPFF